MRNDQNELLTRRILCAAFLGLAICGAPAGCSGPTLVSKYKAPNREEDLVKTLNEERKRAQYYENQYEQAVAKLDQSERHTAKISSSFDRKDDHRSSSCLFTEPKTGQQLVSANHNSPKVLSRLVNTIPGLRMGPDKTWAKLDADLLFSGGSQELSGSASDLLADLAKTLTQESSSDVRVLVVGYSDTQREGEATDANQGEDATWQIAAQRAVGVVRKLTQSGVTPDRLSAMSRGAQDPVAGNDTAAARAQNRRVEIYLLERESTWAPDWTAALR